MIAPQQREIYGSMNSGAARVASRRRAKTRAQHASAAIWFSRRMLLRRCRGRKYSEAQQQRNGAAATRAATMPAACHAFFDYAY
jgi:hypothetical protein